MRFPLKWTAVVTLLGLMPTAAFPQGFGSSGFGSGNSFSGNSRLSGQLGQLDPNELMDALNATRSTPQGSNVRQPGRKLTLGVNSVLKPEEKKLPSDVTGQNKGEIPPDSTAIPSPIASNPSNLFQEFIQQTSGRVLPIYGQTLFERVTSPSEQDATPVPTDYVVGPGDEMQIKIYGSTIDFDQQLVVDRQGMLVLPKIGPVSVTGIRVGDLEKYLKKKVSKVLTNFNIFVSLGRLRGIEIYVVGHARVPGKYIVSSLSTVINALFTTGGPNSNGTLRGIQLVRNGKIVSTIDLYDFLGRGDTSKDTHLLPGDVITIPPVGPMVALTGAIPHPAIFELRTGSKSTALDELIPLAGGIPAQTSPLEVSIERIDSSKAKPIEVKKISLNDKGKTTPLRDGDILTFYPFKATFDNAVTLRVMQADPIRVPIRAGSRIKDILPNKEVLLTSDYYLKEYTQSSSKPVDPENPKHIRLRIELEQVNWEQAIVERKNPTELSLQMIPFNLGKAITEENSPENIELQSGDTITVFGQQTIQTPIAKKTRIVKVTGEVKAPGFYQIEMGETLNKVIERAGGLTDQAYLFGAELSRVSVKARQKENIQAIARQLEDRLASENTIAAASAGSNAELTQVLALNQKNNQLAQSQISRLKELTPNGRIALEIQPEQKRLPDLALENGDEVLIPAQPGYVSAIGAVYNDNVLIYHPGRKVSEYLEAAGVAEWADKDDAFVMRANGSVVSPNDRNVQKLILLPGDTIVVPQKFFRESGYTVFMRGLKDWTQVLFQLGLGAAALKLIR